MFQLQKRIILHRFTSSSYGEDRLDISNEQLFVCQLYKRNKTLSDGDVTDTPAWCHHYIAKVISVLRFAASHVEEQVLTSTARSLVHEMKGEHRQGRNLGNQHKTFRNHRSILATYCCLLGTSAPTNN